MATNTQKVMWTALPNGVVGSPPTALKLSIFVSPQLQSDPTITNPTLALFPDFVNWPATLSKVKFAVQFSNGFKTTATPVLTGPTAPNSSLWSALFPSTTFVRPYSFDDLSNQFIFSYPVVNIYSFIKQQYQQIGGAVSGQTLPSISGPASHPGSLQAFLDANLTIPSNNLQSEITKLEQQYVTSHYIPNAAPGTNTRQDFLMGRWYYYIPPNTPRPPITVPTFDFQQAVSAVGEYPGILRMLGLVVDLTVPYSTSIPTSGPPTVQIVPSWHSSNQVVSTDATPATFFILNASAPPKFMAQPQSSEVINGMLNLSAPGNNYTLIGLDVDSAMFKAVNLAFALQTALTKPSADSPTTSGLPTLRSTGIMLARSGRAGTLVTRFQRSLALHNATSPGLYAEDLVRGYAVDIQPFAGPPTGPWTAGPWYSLMRRVGTYSFPTAPNSLQSITIHDEGNFSIVPTRKPGVGAEFYLHEGQWHWEGYSLAAPRPGASLDGSGTPVRPQNAIQTPFQISTNFAAEPGSLPTLRFGKAYRMRGRLVDLAGNAMPYTSTDDSGAVPSPSSPFVYRRFEPVNAPEVVLHDALFTGTTPPTPLSPGEAVRRLVVRSDYHTTPTNWVTYANSKSGNSFHVTTQRHIAPPRMTEDLAETHGVFDVAAPTASDPNAMRPDPNAYNTVIRYNDFSAGGRFQSDVYNVAQLTMPYFGDVLSHGAYLTGLPGATGATMQAFDGTWPAVQPFQILLQGIMDGSSPPPPSWDPVARILTVQIAQGDTVTVNLSSYLKQSDLQLMAIYEWIQEYFQTTGIVNPFWQAVINAQLQGLHFMMTPWREVTLVHAVQRPLMVPNFSDFFSTVQTNGLVRSAGQTYVTFSEDMPISKKSTNKLDVNATWTDTIDDGANPAGAVMVPASAHAFQVPVNPPSSSSDATQHIDQQHHFGDTKHRMVTYTATATSRFEEYFPADLINDPATGATLTGTPVLKNVESSARPDAPKVLYVIPAFEWSTTSITGGTQIQRVGHRLRVYVDRPWYSSGEGELLAAVVLVGDDVPNTEYVPPPVHLRVGAGIWRSRKALAGGPATETVKLYVTEWGSDPIWANSGDGFAHAPQYSDFGLSPTVAPLALQLPELPGVDLEVAAYPVQFDMTRQLWFADMEVNSGNNYYPMIRLALARYQPNSLPGLELSKVVLADFVQLTPDRSASITFPVDQNHAHVKVTGHRSSLATSTIAEPTSMVVVVEQQAAYEGGTTTGADDFGWVQYPGTTPVTLTPSADTGDISWQGDIDLTGLARPLRLVIKETEIYLADPGSIPSSPVITAHRASAAHATIVPETSRTVYAAIYTVAP